MIFGLAKLGSPHVQAQSSVATVPAAAALQGLATRCSVLERARAPGSSPNGLKLGRRTITRAGGPGQQT